MSVLEIYEHPILFPGAMVRAIISEKKTCTRRLLRPQPTLMDGVWRLSKPPTFWRNTETAAPNLFAWNPFGKTGMRLWVKETYALQPGGRVVYRADFDDAAQAPIPEQGWRPSLYMPRHFSRINLVITGSEVEPLNAITHADAVMEGFDSVIAFYNDWDRLYQKKPESLHVNNPWVWVTRFELMYIDQQHG
jgi:hypothetical protein